MRYSNAKMTGSVSQAASGVATAGNRPALGGAVSDIILAVNERQIAPGETACFPFVARTACTLIIRPCVRAVTEPAVTIWPTGHVCLLLENRGSTGIDVSISIRHRGSDWSKEWEFELPETSDPFNFSEPFDPPAGKRSGDFELPVSAAGVPLVRWTVRARRSLIPRRLISDIQVCA